MSRIFARAREKVGVEFKGFAGERETMDADLFEARWCDA